MKSGELVGSSSSHYSGEMSDFDNACGCHDNDGDGYAYETWEVHIEFRQNQDCIEKSVNIGPCISIENDTQAGLEKTYPISFVGIGRNPLKDGTAFELSPMDYSLCPSHP